MTTRLHLTRPLDGWFGDYPVRLVDVTTTGGLIEHDDVIPVGARALLRFFWRKQEIEITAETSRHIEGESAIHFVENSEQLERLIAESADEVARAQQANFEGDREANVVGEETLTSASAGLRRGRGFIVYTWEESKWVTRRSLLPDQPENGFTVAAGESMEQIEMLCRTYERGDDGARQMTKMLAELSVNAATKLNR